MTRKGTWFGGPVFLMFGILLLAGWAAAAPVPDTGVTACYDMVAEIPCPEEGEPFYGQDANYLINPPSYTKLGEGGGALPDDAEDWATVKDNVTGLIWEVKRNWDSVPNYSDPRDADNHYTWYDPNAPFPGTPGDGTDTKDFIDRLNTLHYGGYDDWRLPTVQELTSLVIYSLSSPSIDPTYFPSTDPRGYWTSTSDALDAREAWLVYFSYGLNFQDFKSELHLARAVRGGQDWASGRSDPSALSRGEKDGEGRYRDNGDGTVSDASTGLMWQQDTARDGQGNWAWMTWVEALAYCRGMTLGGHTDWRLPNLKELCSLVDYTTWNLAIDRNFFPNTESVYWSSTTSANHYPEEALNVEFYYGRNYYRYPKSTGLLVRAVRGDDGPWAIFSAEPTSGTAPLEVVFTDASIGEITTWSWNFGDGGKSGSQNPSHTYTEGGTYTVSLTVSGPAGSDAETKTGYITVTEPPPLAGFSGAPVSGTVPLVVDFTDASIGEITTWSWNFGDGGKSGSQNPSHTYTEEGTYTVSLTVSGPGGSDTQTQAGYITVTGSDCVAEQVLHDHMGKEPERAAGILASLRAFRDALQASGPEGQDLVTMYARHQEEVSQRLRKDPGLAARLAAFIIQAAEAVRMRPDMAGFVIPNSLLPSLDGIMLTLHGMASTALKEDLQKLRAYVEAHGKGVREDGTGSRAQAH